MTPRLLTYGQVCDRLCVGIKVVRKLCGTRHLARRRFGARTVRITADSVERLIAQIERDNGVKLKAS